MSEVPRIVGALAPQIITHRVERDQRHQQRKHHAPGQDAQDKAFQSDILELHEDGALEQVVSGSNQSKSDDVNTAQESPTRLDHEVLEEISKFTVTEREARDQQEDDQPGEDFEFQEVRSEAANAPSLLEHDEMDPEFHIDLTA